MIIDSAKIQFHGQHRQLQQHQRSESLQIRHPVQTAAPPPAATTSSSQSVAASPSEKTHLDLQQAPDAEHALTLEIIRRMFKAITGEELVLFSPNELKDETESIAIQAPSPAPSQGQDETTWVYEQTSTYAEAEISRFNAEGKIVTRDGQEIAFSVSLNMSREFYSTSHISASNAPKTDPLVINFDGQAAELSETKFRFDIDVNGTLDQIAMLTSNSGLLALDKNGDGRINDGSELFGAQTGNGFNELAAYDEDGNQFIDAGDAIYERLRIWQQHEDGSQQLVALGDKNIGALFLGHLTTPFQLKTSDNQSLGEVASSGIYLTEQGTTGTMQQINFTV